MKAFFSRLALASCLLFAAGGCVISPASWLPDSSGFLFVRTEESGKQTVHHYDLAKKAHKAVAMVADEIASDLAVHPKGESFALVIRSDKGHRLSIHAFSGEEQHNSGLLDF